VSQTYGAQPPFEGKDATFAAEYPFLETEIKLKGLL